MGRIVVTEYISVDGVVEAPSGSEDFARVGWVDDFRRGRRATNSRSTRQWHPMHCCSVDAYDGFAGLAACRRRVREKFNTMPHYVVSSTLEGPEWNNTTVLRGDVIEEVGKLKAQCDGDIVVHGSPQLAQTLIEHELVDELRLMVYPVIVGAGKRLFAETSGTKRLRLVEARTVGDGIHILTYQPAMHE